jgi:hypothetical protein
MESKLHGVSPLMHSVMALDARSTFQNYDLKEAITAMDSLLQVQYRLGEFIAASTKHLDVAANIKMERSCFTSMQAIQILKSSLEHHENNSHRSSDV